MAILRTIRLLVVEDNPAYLYLIQKAFSDRREQTRWELTVAIDGEEALHVLFEEENKSVPLSRSHSSGLESAERIRR